MEVRKSQLVLRGRVEIDSSEILVALELVHAVEESVLNIRDSVESGSCVLKNPWIILNTDVLSQHSERGSDIKSTRNLLDKSGRQPPSTLS